MKWTAGTDVTYPINYIVDGEYVIPSSAQATVRYNSGATIAGLTNQALAVDSTSTQLAIPAQHNTLAIGKDFEIRYIDLSFVHEDKTYHQTHRYELREFLPISVGPDDVRAVIGLDRSELPDDDIDVHAAYLRLSALYGTRITDALTAGNVKTLAVNKAITLRAALEIVNSLQFRVTIKMKAEDSAAERMSQFDVNKIRIQLGQELSFALDTVLDTTTGGSQILVLSNPTDAITGE